MRCSYIHVCKSSESFFSFGSTQPEFILISENTVFNFKNEHFYLDFGCLLF